tara:strand:- start:154 stop:471 length:318 start_codon:yes stop_codon:yes gene_type:complete
MTSGSYLYQKGDLITIKESSMILFWQMPSSDRSFRTTKKPTSAIFLGLAKEMTSEEDVYTYLVNCTPIRNPCKVAIGDAVAYVDQSHFFFYNRRKNEKINRSYAE